MLPNDGKNSLLQQGHVAAQYKLLGVINVRQLRVTKDACKVRKRMQVIYAAELRLPFCPAGGFSEL